MFSGRYKVSVFCRCKNDDNGSILPFETIGIANGNQCGIRAAEVLEERREKGLHNLFPAGA